MSTYADTPYIHARIPGVGHDQPFTCAELFPLVQKLRNTFAEAGWSIQLIGGMETVRTHLDFTFSFCIIGPGGSTNYRLTYSDSPGLPIAIVIDDPTTCCDAACEAALAAQTPSITTIFGTTSTTARQATNTATVDAIKWMYDQRGLNVLSGTQEDVGVGDWRTPIFFDPAVFWDCPGYFVTIGGQTGASYVETFGGELFNGLGFIATSQDNTVGGNSLEVYVHIADRGSGLGPGLYIATRDSNNFGTFLSEYPAKHPHQISNAERGSVPQGVERHFMLRQGDDIHVFVNSYNYFMNQPGGGSFELEAHGGAVKLKALEGELGTPKVSRATWFGGRDDPSTGGERLYEALSSRDPGLIEMTVEGGGSVTQITPLQTLGNENRVISFPAYTALVDGNHPNGLTWEGDIAIVAEPWVAMNPYQDSSVMPVVGQISDAIIPWRAIALGTNPPSPDEVFTWDLQYWRYFQPDRETGGRFTNQPSNTGPGSSLALRVKDVRIYNGTAFTGPPAYPISSVSVSPDPVPAGAGGNVTINIDTTTGAGLDLSLGGTLIITSNNERVQFQGTPDHYVSVPALATSVVVPFTTIDLDQEEDVTIVVIGENQVATQVTVTLSGTATGGVPNLTLGLNPLIITRSAKSYTVVSGGAIDITSLVAWPVIAVDYGNVGDETNPPSRVYINEVDDSETNSTWYGNKIAVLLPVSEEGEAPVGGDVLLSQFRSGWYHSKKRHRRVE
jgi:hypothetical protein